jgi:hypothetical protein
LINIAEGFLSGVGSDPAVPRKVTVSIFGLSFNSQEKDILDQYHSFHRPQGTALSQHKSHFSFINWTTYESISPIMP